MPPDVAPIETRRVLADEAGVGERTFSDATQILDAVDAGWLGEETLDAIRDGKTSIHGVAKSLKAKPARKAKSSGWQAAVKAFAQVVRRFIRRDPSHKSEIAASLRAIADEIERNDQALAA